MNPIPMNRGARPIGKGCRVSLLYTANSSTKLRNSDRGIVTGTWKDSKGVLNVDVDWDIGEKLTLSTDKDCFEYFWLYPGQEVDSYRTKKIRPRRSKSQEAYYAIKSKSGTNSNPYYGFYLHVKNIIGYEGTKSWPHDDTAKVSLIRDMLEKYDARSKK